MKKNARILRIVVALSLCVVCLCATTGSALARTTYTTTIDFTAGKDAYGPGGSNYHKKATPLPTGMQLTNKVGMQPRVCICMISSTGIVQHILSP